MTTINRDTIVDALKTNHKVQVVFTKVNGDKRTMNCSLHKDIIPADKLPMESTTSPKTKNTSIVSAWDIDSDGWRSFKVANVINIEVVI